MPTERSAYQNQSPNLSDFLNKPSQKKERKKSQYLDSYFKLMMNPKLRDMVVVERVWVADLLPAQQEQTVETCFLSSHLTPSQPSQPSSVSLSSYLPPNLLFDGSFLPDSSWFIESYLPFKWSSALLSMGCQFTIWPLDLHFNL